MLIAGPAEVEGLLTNGLVHENWMVIRIRLHVGFSYQVLPAQVPEAHDSLFISALPHSCTVGRRAKIDFLVQGVALPLEQLSTLIRVTVLHIECLALSYGKKTHLL